MKSSGGTFCPPVERPRGRRVLAGSAAAAAAAAAGCCSLLPLLQWFLPLFFLSLSLFLFISTSLQLSIFSYRVVVAGGDRRGVEERDGVGGGEADLPRGPCDSEHRRFIRRRRASPGGAQHGLAVGTRCTRDLTTSSERPYCALEF